MTKIKICGLTQVSDIEVVNEIKPEFAGFVFWPKSKRYITPDRAAVLKEKLDKDIKAVGVFLDEEVSAIAEIANAGIIDMIQLHGHEDNAFIKRLKELTDLPVIQAVILGDTESEKTQERINASAADYILVDSGAGSGRLIDPKRLNEVSGEYFLAGGLSTENIEELVKKYRPYAVDVSSGVETDGHKDAKKMRDFVRIVRSTCGLEG